MVNNGLYHVRVDDVSLAMRCHLTIATGQNNLAMKRTVIPIGREIITEPVADGTQIPEPLLDWVEAGIRCSDLCLLVALMRRGRCRCGSDCAMLAAGWWRSECGGEV